MKSVFLLKKNCPDWITLKNESMSELVVEASTEGQDSLQSQKYLLSLKFSDKDGLTVSEVDNCRKLPKACPERHINSNSTFCLFVDSTAEILSDGEAVEWWKSLLFYLDNQNYAEKHGIWPIRGGLSHGYAAQHQIIMEKIAERIGWEDEILESIFRNDGWFFEFVRKKTKILRKSSCPRGCTRKHKQLRKFSCNTIYCCPNCKKIHKQITFADCPNRENILKLMEQESLRQKKENLFFDILRKKKIQCCGTMKNCALK